jgi:O-antigen/teichoic acid export membrane protein
MKLSAKFPTHLIVAASGWLGRGTEAVVQLVSITLLLSYLGIENFAIFALLISLTVWFNLLDLGIGPSIQNFLSEAQASQEPPEEVLDQVKIIILFLAAIFLILLLLVHQPLQAILLRGLVSPGHKAPPFLLGLVGCFFIMTALASVSYRVLYAKHQGYLAQFYQAGARLVSLIGIFILVATYSGTNKLILSLLIWVVPPFLLASLAMGQLLSALGTRVVKVNWTSLKTIAKRSLKFGAFTAISTATIHVDYLIMSQTLGAKEITQYNILSKLFNFLLVLYWAMLMAIWPELTERFAKGEWASAKRLIKIYQGLGGLVIGAGTVGILITLPSLLAWFLPQHNLQIPIHSVLLFGAFCLLRGWCDTYATALMSLNHFRAFWIAMPIQTILSCLGQYFLSQLWGINGILLGLIISFALTATWVLPLEFQVISRSNIQIRTIFPTKEGRTI